MKKRYVGIGVVAMAIAAQTATAQFFTNDLTDATSAALDFTENGSISANGVWSYTNDYALAEDGTTNTVLQGGAVLDWATADDDSARTYLATVYSNYMDHSWTARVAVEAPASTKPWIFVGLGSGKPASSYYYEPRDGQSVYLRFQSGVSSRKITILDHTGATLEPTGAWQGDPGYDFYLTYNHLTKTLKFEVDNWNGGRFSGINVSTTQISVGDILTDTDDAHIFFGSNAKVTWGDFEVYEIESSAVPTPPLNLYAWPDTNDIVSVYWDEEAFSTDGYNVYRSLDDVASNYVQIATAMTNSYTDTDVSNGLTYYYKVAGTNEHGEGEFSNSEMAVPNEHLIIGQMNNASATEDRWFYELFDKNLNTFMDDNTTGGYGGLDYGDGNDQQILQVGFRLRNDGWGNDKNYDVIIDGETNSANRSQYFTYGNTFEGSDDGVSWTVLATITNFIPEMGVWNQLPVSDTAAYRYVRYYPTSGNNNFAMADVQFLTENDFTDNGTLVDWLEAYGLTEADDEEDNDLDGLLTWEEYVAGTNPTNAASVLELNSVANTTNGLVLVWQSVEGKDYSILTNTSLTVGTPGVAVSNIMGQATETSYTTTVSGAGTVFYEVGVE